MIIDVDASQKERRVVAGQGLNHQKDLLDIVIGTVIEAHISIIFEEGVSLICIELPNIAKELLIYQ
jgi:hypothetical protein